ncbi:glycine--tRNA ligase subunit beta [Oceaniglobus ichthyenteri]|uniref:glycine--tRNA ligase subunit beta n=1 Tax=Oceaniglobus ichthyenteri TaxID=2136177 RepID=UPI000D355F2D|nr:glycine--tRNA ligase subunit beta [Oceaniglobus ichthyenteri]
MADLLIELLSEEIPARMQAKAAADLKQRVTDGLVEAGLTYASAGAFHTPRRLTLSVEGLLATAPAQREERKGPRVDAPEKAVEGFLRSTGLSRDDLQIRDDKKGQVYMAIIETPGRAADGIVAEVLEKVVRNFPWPKSMRWGAGDLRWVRPLQSILCILSDESGHRVVELNIDGTRAGDVTRGHRFMSPGEFSVANFDDYAAKLKRAHVILSAKDRADHIWADATNQAFASGLEVVEDPGLLAEVAGLVEWPVVLMGEIGADFLHLPPEVLQTSMREHQKFFSVKDPKSGQIVRFVTVANRTTADEGATILAGNQKVLSARLSDARFFWDNDLRIAKSDLGQWVSALETVTFHNKLGTVADRMARVSALAREIAPLVGADPDQAALAANLAKADLQSQMVGEFPELQGLMGRYYIAEAGHPADVAAVAQEHYAPLGPSDQVPTAPLSVAVALADKLDILAGFWAIDEKPTGSKDPFALRRAALGVIRLILHNKLDLDLLALVRRALVPFATKLENTAFELLSFIHERMKVNLRDSGFRHDVIDAILGLDKGNNNLTFILSRAHALSEMLKTDDGENLLQGFKRANNILAQAEAKDGVEYSYGADVKFAETDAEKELFAALDRAETVIAPAMQAEDFATAMSAMAALRAPIDGFFNAVQVNAESQIIRRNRLNLLSRIRTICLGVADLNRIEG